jgi:hypothetical protein
MKFGVFDTVDELWIGDENGPKLFEFEDLAKLAAMIVDKRLKQPLGRSRALPFDEKQSVHYKDTVNTVMDSKQAIEELEEGR